jgi:hypothetical protein
MKENEEGFLNLKSWPIGYTARSTIECRALVAACHARERVANQALRDVFESTTLEDAKRIVEQAIHQTCSML